MHTEKKNIFACDVAAEIMKLHGPMTAMKLQKLLYYCQAWSLVWDEKPLFPEKIEAWANGPIAPEIYKYHKGKFELTDWPLGDVSKLSDSQKETIKQVVDFYGEKSGQWLSELTHQEAPWKDARKNLSPGERGSQEITLASMAEYYGSL